jgi:hypothetical protein
MQRRAFLATAGLGGLVGIAGCAGDGPAGSGDTTASDIGGSDTPRGSATATDDSPASVPPPERFRNVELPVPDDELNRGASEDGIPAIVDPVFADDWSAVDDSLSDDSRVIGIVRDGDARAYPLAVLNWHEIVNDTFEVPVLVTYCPLCGSGVVADRRIDGEPATFGVSGLLWNSDLVMYDTVTDSLWSQLLGTAIRGPATGTELTLLPATMATWGEWRTEYPETQVLLPPPESNTVRGRRQARDYDRDPYAGYDRSARIGIGYNDFSDDRLDPKASVIGVYADGVARAYPLEAVWETGVVNDTVGDLPVVVSASVNGTLVAYDRRVAGETLSFERDPETASEDGLGDEDATPVLRAGDSAWGLLTGEGRSGPLADTPLRRANDRSQLFWFAWADFHPETELWRP